MTYECPENCPKITDNCKNELYICESCGEKMCSNIEYIYISMIKI